MTINNRIKFITLFLIMQFSHSLFADGYLGTPIEGAFGFVLGEKVNYFSENKLVNPRLFVTGIEQSPISAYDIQVKPIIKTNPFEYYFLLIVPSTGELAQITAYGKKGSCIRNKILMEMLQSKYEVNYVGKMLDYGWSSLFTGSDVGSYEISGKKLHLRCYESYSYIIYYESDLSKKAVHEISNIHAKKRVRDSRINADGL